MGCSLAVGGRPDAVVSWETIDALLDELDRLTPPFGGAPLSLPKQIAALALYAQVTTGAGEEIALQGVVRELGERLPRSPGALRKAASEARAILQFGLKGDGFQAPSDDRPIPLLHAIAGALDTISLREATKARAAQLAGVRGGRRHGTPLQTLRAVRGLVERAHAGAAEAEAELAEIRELLGL